METILLPRRLLVMSKDSFDYHDWGSKLEEEGLCVWGCSWEPHFALLVLPFSVFCLPRRTFFTTMMFCSSV
jgi:hypothetical protein